MKNAAYKEKNNIISIMLLQLKNKDALDILYTDFVKITSILSLKVLFLRNLSILLQNK